MVQLESTCSHRPPNSLLTSLSPSGKTLYLPPGNLSPRESSSSLVGYLSDPGPDVQRPKHLDPTSEELNVGELADNLEEKWTVADRHAELNGNLSLTRHARTASYQTLLRLVDLKDCISDDQGSLSDIVRSFDKTLESESIFSLRREVSEREACLNDLLVDRDKIVKHNSQLRRVLENRVENLNQRREILAVAKGKLRHEHHIQQEIFSEINKRRVSHRSLQARFTPTRTTLLNTLSSIFPIELSSYPDSLFTILGVPLPIPISSKDPAPPSSLLGHSEVTEESNAAALGYVAQVVHLLAGYLEKELVYPITCISSRSLIRDDISSMVGPRMFPLYSKGVDAYRFEYGVFLLNKDIELLMADRDLRALDMRHTLPNLKNLLLTLTDGKGVLLRRPLTRSDSQTILASKAHNESSSESVTVLSAALDSSGAGMELTANSNTVVPTIGATNLTVTTMDGDSSRVLRPLFKLSPFSDFFRTYNPSGSSHDSQHPSDPYFVQVEGGESTVSKKERNKDFGNENEDRKTISGQAREDDQMVIGGFATLTSEEQKYVTTT